MTAALPDDRPDASLARLRTAANALSGARLVLAPVMALAVARGASGLALAVFAAAVASDLADGRLARRSGAPSAFGGVIDHGSDAAFVSAGLLGCAAVGSAPFVLPILVMLAFLQYALDSRVLGGGFLRASALGRWNGVAYFVLLGVPVVRDGARIGWPPDGLVFALGWALAATTLVSMGLRAKAWLARRPRGVQDRARESRSQEGDPCGKEPL